MSSLVLSRDGKRIRETKKNEEKETAIRVLLLVIESGFVEGANRFCPLEFSPIAAVYKRGLLRGTGRFQLRRCRSNNQAIAWAMRTTIVFESLYMTSTLVMTEFNDCFHIGDCECLCDN